MRGLCQAVLSLVIVVLLATVLGLAAFASERLLFADDFTEDQSDVPPAKWKVYAGRIRQCRLRHRAAYGPGGSHYIGSSKENTSISAMLWDPPASEAKTIVVEHWVRSSPEKNNMYISKEGRHRLHWWVSGVICTSIAVWPQGRVPPE